MRFRAVDGRDVTVEPTHHGEGIIIAIHCRDGGGAIAVVEVDANHAQAFEEGVRAARLEADARRLSP